jgi:hypothetical protein
VNENKNLYAEAVLIVIKRLAKWGLIGAAGIAAISTVGVLAFQFYEYLTEGRHAEKVTVSAFYAPPNVCSNDYPFMYMVSNKSDKTVSSVDFRLAVFKNGHSTAINDYTSLTDDKILKSGETSSNCWRTYYTDDRAKLIKDSDVNVVVKYKNVSFVKN